jgi:predicted nucleic acid-binding protein
MDVLVDTNILIRRIHHRDPKHRETRQALGVLRRRGDRICVTAQNLIECWAVCTRPVQSNGLGLTPDQTDRIASRIEELCSLLPDSPGVYTEWRRLVVAHSVSGKKTHDARLVAVMQVYGIHTILTFNLEDFKRYPGIRAVHPREVVADRG